MGDVRAIVLGNLARNHADNAWLIQSSSQNYIQLTMILKSAPKSNVTKVLLVQVERRALFPKCGEPLE